MSSLDTELDSLRISLKDILIATEDFSERNLLKRSRKADVYKGLLLRSKVGINVVIRKYSGGVFKFYEKIKRISTFSHRNAVSFIGFCDENGERIIVIEHVVNGSFQKYLSDPISLTWSQRLNICFGAALVLRSWHHVNNFNYFYIKKGGFKILLDKDWEAKVEIGIASHGYQSEKSDVQSLGVLILEVLYGRKATTKEVNQYRAKIAKTQYHEPLDDIIAPSLRKQILPESLSILSLIAYYCLKEQPDQESIYMFDQIVKRLREAFEIQWKHENHLWLEKFACLKIPLSHIKLATDDFSNMYCIMSEQLLYERVYKVELDHFDTESELTMDRENKGEIQKKTVIIHRINRFKNMPKNFFAEIEMLTNCKHDNLLSFLGFCDEDSERILVFDCPFKETLENYLINAKERTNITWQQQIRICLGIAHGLKYVHNMEGKPNHVIQIQHVFLDENLTVKIGNFRLSKCDTSFWQSRQEKLNGLLFEAMYSPWIPPGHVVDYIFSLGVVLFEILTGKLAYDQFYLEQHVSKGLHPSDKGKLKSMADPRIMEEDKHSLDSFTEIAYQCLAETPSERPTFDDVIKSLGNTLHIQVKKLGYHEFLLEDIKSATESFDSRYRIGKGGYGEVYKAELKMKFIDEHPDTTKTAAIKRIIGRTDSQGIQGFFAELDVIRKCKHPNIVSLMGICVEDGEMLLVYEHASNGSLEDYLERVDRMSDHTWVQRLKICIDIAQGLKYMHTTIKDKKRIIHRDIKSANILLGKNLEAKIADFGLSKIHHGYEGVSTVNTKTLAGTEFYLDPEYARTGRLKKASDIYSLGVVLFEIYSGKLAYNPDYININEKGLASIARRHFKKGKLKEVLDPKIMDETIELGFTGKVEPDQDSLDVFSKIAFQCVAKAQGNRPKIEVVIEELKKAFHLQVNRIKTLNFPRDDIRFDIESFSGDKRIIRRRYGMLHRGKVQYNDTHKKVALKWFSRDIYFLKEFEILFKYKHENIIGLIGYCKEMKEKIIIYEHASMGSLNRYLNNASFSWTKRLKICIDIANGLKFLHEGGTGLDLVIHADIKSSNILLTKDWKAKIYGFEHALTYATNKEIEYVFNDFGGSPRYSDPMFHETHFLTKESDIYSLGVILFEILCGRLACPKEQRDRGQFLDVAVERPHFQVAPLDEIVFEGIKEQVGQNSFAAFRRVAFQCLLDKREERPTAGDVVIQLQKALEFQEAYEIREAKLHRSGTKVLSKSLEICSKMAKNEIYNILSKGTLLKDDKLEIIRVLETRWDHKQFISEEEDNYHSESIISTAMRKKLSRRRNRSHSRLLQSKAASLNNT